MREEEIFASLTKKKLVKYGSVSIVPSSFEPQDTEVRDGIMTRYFVRRTNIPTEVLEIDKNKFQDLQPNPFYTGVSILWSIRGEIESRVDKLGKQDIFVEGVRDFNKKRVEQVKSVMPGLSRYIKDYTQFWQGP